MNETPLSQEDRFLAQYLLPTKLHGSSKGFDAKMYAVYRNDMTDKRENDNGLQDVAMEKESGCIQLENDQKVWLTLSTA